MPIYEFAINKIIRLFLFTDLSARNRKYPMKTLIRQFFANMMHIL